MPKHKILQCSLLELSVSWTEIYAIKIIPQTIIFFQPCLYHKMKGNVEICKLVGHRYGAVKHHKALYHTSAPRLSSAINPGFLALILSRSAVATPIIFCFIAVNRCLRFFRGELAQTCKGSSKIRIKL